jgi:hypothetical protein
MDFDDEETGTPGPGVLATLSVNDSPGGKPSKLKGSLNALLGHAPSTAIIAFDDETFEVEYADDVVEQIEVGLRCEARGEWNETGDTPQYKLVAFRPLGGKRATQKTAPVAAAAATISPSPQARIVGITVDPDDIPF